MIPLEALKNVKKVITHANCADGMASALILQHALPGVQIQFVSYGTEEHANLPVEEGLLFCDMSPPAERADAFRFVKAIVLDHHKTAKDVVESFGELGIYADEVKRPGVSGAWLAYEEVWQLLTGGESSGYIATSSKMRSFATLAGIRDTWQRQHRDWELACAQAFALTFYPAQLLLKMASIDFDQTFHDIEQMGDVLLWKRKIAVERAAEGMLVETFRYAGTVAKIAFIQNSELTSDLAEYLDARDHDEQPDLIVGFSFFAEKNELRINYSMRSHKTFDCGKFAKARGGGGHTRAAGFTVKGDNVDIRTSPYVLFFDELRDHLDGVENQR